MLHSDLLCKLRNYKATWAQGLVDYDGYCATEEMRRYDAFIAFLQDNPFAFDRELKHGHVTASALVCSYDFEKIILMHHRKLDKWIQLGGHADGNSFTVDVAIKEAKEESGLRDLVLLNYQNAVFGEQSDKKDELIPFDIDIHTIPARKNEPEHLHYDVRYLFTADPAQNLVCNHEARQLRWLDLKTARQLTNEPSMIRQFYKLEAIARRIKQSQA